MCMCGILGALIVSIIIGFLMNDSNPGKGDESPPVNGRLGQPNPA